jgi:hypothetical protein
MARSRKTGLDYFPLDCQMDDKIDMLEAEHGLIGFAVYIKLLQLIYQTESGELDMSNVFRWKTLGKKWDISEETLRKLVDTMCEVALFDKESLAKHLLLTSTGVQKRLGKVATLRKKDRQRHEKGDISTAKSFSGGKSAENATKEKESKEKVNTADAVARGHTTPISSSLSEHGLEVLADEARIFLLANFTAFVDKMGYGHIDKGHYLSSIQRKAEKQKPRTNERWEDYILAWLQNDQNAGRLMLATTSSHTHPGRGSTSFNIQESITKNQQISC